MGDIFIPPIAYLGGLWKLFCSFSAFGIWNKKMRTDIATEIFRFIYGTVGIERGSK
jgi:hypothetical protein